MTPLDDLPDLAQGLVDARTSLLVYDAFFEDGTYNELDVPRGARAELYEIISSGVTNWLKLIIETTAERLIVDGFRRENDTETNSDLWRYWQANKLDGRQMALNVETLKFGYSYVSVWPGRATHGGGEDRGSPVISPESPLFTHVSYDEADPFVASSAFKIRGGRAWLYTPSFVFSLVEDVNSITRWKVTGSFENPLGVVPFVKFRANPDLSGGSASDLDVAIPIQKRINRTTVDRLIAAHFSAFRQRYATGLVLDTDDDGNAVAPFNVAVDRLWTTDDPEVKFGEFSEATLSNYIAAVEADVHHLAAVTRTPAQYLLGQMVNVSAEALVAAESGLARKIAERQLTFGESWEDVIRLAAKASGEELSEEDSRIETIWRQTETVSDAQIVDAATKLLALEIPKEALWERIGATPQEITRWRRMATSESLRASLRDPNTNPGGIGDIAEIVPEIDLEEAA